MCEELEEGAAGQHFIQCVQLTADYGFHIVNIGNAPYVVSAEISKLLWDSDRLRSMVSFYNLKQWLHWHLVVILNVRNVCITVLHF